MNNEQKFDSSTSSPIVGYAVLPAVPAFDYIKCPLHRYTFSVKPIREWTERNCEGKTLNLFAGRTKLNIDEVRNDLDEEALAD